MHQSVIDPQALNDLKILIVIALCLLFSVHIAKILRLPVAATEILLGAVIAYFGFISKSENFDLLANVGFYYLMFIAGMEVNLRDFFNMDRQIAKKSFFYILSLYILSSFVVWICKLSLVFVIIIPVMSVGLLALLFKDFGKECYWLNVAMIVATLAEVVSIVFLTIADAFLREGTSVIDVVQSILYLNIFLGLCWLCFKMLGVLFWWYPQLKVVLMPWEDKDEKDIRFCMAIFILIIVAMVITKLEIVLGSFIAGSFIATFFDHKKDLEHKLSAFGHGFLIPVFFIHIGSTFDLRMILDYKIVLEAFFLMFVMIGLRIVCASIFFRKIGFKNTILFALSHSMPLTLLIATATLGYSGKVIDEKFYAALILTALFEAIIVMSAIKFLALAKK
ncbi:cation:proton antiporter [Campylobacter sp. VicNov18]|uniref:cation:proton antiporter n=1 Tax=Campylobacter bilis TaxID=2691918 RepID=UPI00130E485A|nr:cation:proton antiporter [Campylobacter bilis]MPV64214.1 cation:proton antiporter [Campylobacter hepaticus]MBM0637718.1 cation:proton antiporter [Campylobacter bilis]MCC8278443.1 cation:proton antiporter [Campylobacter bilis]MCC8299947.1 cation:proton antiporter [Campylobacter bilis]MCC8301352.1 cation:proton antiporter [Campylobacter bilis]